MYLVYILDGETVIAIHKEDTLALAQSVYKKYPPQYTKEIYIKLV